jgi:hypothetical protein
MKAKKTGPTICISVYVALLTPDAQPTCSFGTAAVKRAMRQLRVPIAGTSRRKDRKTALRLGADEKHTVKAACVSRPTIMVPTLPRTRIATGRYRSELRINEVVRRRYSRVMHCSVHSAKRFAMYNTSSDVMAVLPKLIRQFIATRTTSSRVHRLGFGPDAS